MSNDAASGLLSIVILLMGFAAFYFIRPISIFFLLLGAFLIPSGFKYLCLIPLLLYLIRCVRRRDTKALIVYFLAALPAISIGGHSVWNETAWGKRLAAERAAQPVVLTPSQQAALACARELKTYLTTAKATAAAADKAMDRDWSAREIDQACRVTLKFQAEKTKKYMKLSDLEVAAWNNRIKSVESAVRDFAAVASRMESDMRAIVAKHFPPEALEGDITPFGAVIDPFADIPRRTEEKINARFVAWPKWEGDAQFSALFFIPGEPESTRKAKGDKFCASFFLNNGIAEQLTSAVNHGLTEVERDLNRFDPPKPTKKFDISQPAKQ